MAVVSSHTLNGNDGTHAGNVDVALVHLDSGKTLFSTQTDTAGRLSESVDLSDMQPTDRYELIFTTTSYWANLGISHTQKIDEIVLRLTMPDPYARYHLPVILSPNSYSTWASLPE